MGSFLIAFSQGDVFAPKKHPSTKRLMLARGICAMTPVTLVDDREFSTKNANNRSFAAKSGKSGNVPFFDNFLSEYLTSYSKQALLLDCLDFV